MKINHKHPIHNQIVDSQLLKSQTLTSLVNVSLRWQIPRGISGGLFSGQQVVQPPMDNGMVFHRPCTPSSLDGVGLSTRWMLCAGFGLFGLGMVTKCFMPTV